jgi:hypothetical protein
VNRTKYILFEGELAQVNVILWRSYEIEQLPNLGLKGCLQYSSVSMDRNITMKIVPRERARSG